MAGILTWFSAVFAKPDLAASWLQAFAAIVALGISAWATWRVGAVERRRDRLQARGIAVAIYPELLKLRVTITDIRSGLTRQQGELGNLAGQSVVAGIQSVALISTPPMIDRNIDRLFVLGNLAGPSCLALVGMLIQYNDFVYQLTSRFTMMAPRQWADALPQLEDHLDLLDKVTEKCEREVKPIHDSIEG